MEKAKKFLRTPWGLAIGAVLLVTLVVAYASKIPGFGLVRKAASKLPGSDVAAG
jgi:hypothetical protein